MTTWARQVYQAGSRVGAESDGSARNRHPSTSSRTRPKTTTSQPRSRSGLRPSGTRVTSGVTVSVAAIGCRLPFRERARPVTLAPEPPEDTGRRPATDMTLDHVLDLFRLREARQVHHEVRWEHRLEDRVVLVSWDRRHAAARRLRLRKRHHEASDVGDREAVVGQLLLVQEDL